MLEKLRRLTRTKLTVVLSLLGLVALSRASKFPRASSISADIEEGEITAITYWQRDENDSMGPFNYASIAGKSEIVLTGLGWDLTPENNRIQFECADIGLTAFGPKLNRKLARLRAIFVALKAGYLIFIPI